MNNNIERLKITFTKHKIPTDPEHLLKKNLPI